MSALTAGGGSEEDTPSHKKFLERFLGGPGVYNMNQPIGPRRLSERTITSLLSRACNISEIKVFLDLTKEYKAEWTGAQQISHSDEFGWVEMLQYRPGILAAAVLQAQKLAGEPLSPSFRQAVAYATGWPLKKVMGFQMGISNQLIENPTGGTDEHYLNGVALGYLFYESRLAQQERKKQDESRGNEI